jgi:hypothetical protein
MRFQRTRSAWLRAVHVDRVRARRIRAVRWVGFAAGALAFVAIAATLRPVEAVSPGNGILLYSDGSNAEPWVRDWNGSVWTSPAKSDDVHEWRVAASAASSIRDEIIAVGVNIHDEIRGQMWNGSTWSEFPFGTLDSADQTYWWSQDVAYEQVSGDAVLVWSNGTSSMTPLSYRTWNGSS